MLKEYKIKVKDEAESKEAQELFFELGATWPDLTKDIIEVPYVDKHLFLKDGFVTYGGWESYSYHGGKELTLPQLRDLVVLNRNDVRDATHKHKNFEQARSIILSATNEVCDWVEGKWRITCRQVSELTPISNQDPALISGAEALRALADGKEVEYLEVSGKWRDAKFLTANVLLVGDFSIRLKPKTIKVELDLPKWKKIQLDANNVIISFDDHDDAIVASDLLRGALK